MRCDPYVQPANYVAVVEWIRASRNERTWATVSFISHMKKEAT
jgi:hypothetical protein